MNTGIPPCEQFRLGHRSVGPDGGGTMGLAVTAHHENSILAKWRKSIGEYKKMKKRPVTHPRSRSPITSEGSPKLGKSGQSGQTFKLNEVEIRPRMDPTAYLRTR